MKFDRWLSKLKVAVGWRLLFHPAFGRVLYSWHGGLVPYGGHRFNLAIDGHVPYQQAASLFLGFYEKSERLLIVQHLRPGLDVIELGSGIGIISCSILKRLNPGSSLLCVEASPQGFLRLKENIHRNYPTRKVCVFSNAITYGDASTVKFNLDENILGSSTSKDSAVAVEVQVATLSEIYRESGFTRFALVSDIEGAEVGLLLRDQGTLEHCEQIIMELHATSFDGQSYSVGDLEKMVHKMGFRCARRRRNVFAFERDPSRLGPQIAPALHLPG